MESTTTRTADLRRSWLPSSRLARRPVYLPPGSGRAISPIDGRTSKTSFLHPRQVGSSPVRAEAATAVSLWVEASQREIPAQRLVSERAATVRLGLEGNTARLRESWGRRMESLRSPAARYRAAVPRRRMLHLADDELQGRCPWEQEEAPESPLCDGIEVRRLVLEEWTDTTAVVPHCASAGPDDPMMTHVAATGRAEWRPP